jgi:hypothetical protein
VYPPCNYLGQGFHRKRWHPRQPTPETSGSVHIAQKRSGKTPPFFAVRRTLPSTGCATLTARRARRSRATGWGSAPRSPCCTFQVKNGISNTYACVWAAVRAKASGLPLHSRNELLWFPSVEEYTEVQRELEFHRVSAPCPPLCTICRHCHVLHPCIVLQCSGISNQRYTMPGDYGPALSPRRPKALPSVTGEGPGAGRVDAQVGGRARGVIGPSGGAAGADRRGAGCEGGRPGRGSCPCHSFSGSWSGGLSNKRQRGGGRPGPWRSWR